MAVGPSQAPAPATRSPTKAKGSLTKAGKNEAIKNLIGAAENGDLATIRSLLEHKVRRKRESRHTCHR